MITRESAGKALAEIVEEFGLYHTATSAYLSLPGEPCCILGHLLKRLDPDVLEVIERNPTRWNRAAINNLYGAGVVDMGMDGPLCMALLRIQTKQDKGMCWGQIWEQEREWFETVDKCG